ncbi:hypothetical protein Pmar_PMAR000464 [Perkinsus marinus ATCC 50983]|uniref:RRM domain-containing protein n=1 Tax=Perkinsus marinus (strain ATCC 50983 / TXsc) TaxID=423536 RepID=C5L4I6_PERM5|nr:hypothetical protein Pmar_PMAR000464 [Perkinsus marinus ATCC 50983]EER08423.1 hypothetical protein Pmar_PMAR000464 [Perkinsus marinus ATCC 50983]|eukprot:XP_002776607.1 hypothetical protein Pmar_PMAR000464 [Perkinsus marinus ATCC 50983]
MDVLELLGEKEEGIPVEAATKAITPADATQTSENVGETKKRKRNRERRQKEGAAKRSKGAEGEPVQRAPKKIDKDKAARSVFLNNLPVEASSEWIKTTVLGVLPEGNNDPAVIERVYIGRDRKYPTRCAGWANVTFTSEGVAKDAIEKLDYTMLDCEALLKEAEDKEQNMAATVGKEGGSVNKRSGGHGPKGVRVTRRCLYATSGLARLDAKGDHASKSTASQFRLPPELIGELKELVREHGLSDSPAGRLADSYRRTFGKRAPVQEYGFKNFVTVVRRSVA